MRYILILSVCVCAPARARIGRYIEVVPPFVGEEAVPIIIFQTIELDKWRLENK